MGIDWSLFNPKFGEQLGQTFDPNIIAQKQNALANAAMAQQLQALQIQHQLQATQQEKTSLDARNAALSTLSPETRNNLVLGMSIKDSEEMNLKKDALSKFSAAMQGTPIQRPFQNGDASTTSPQAYSNLTGNDAGSLTDAAVNQALSTSAPKETGYSLANPNDYQSIKDQLSRVSDPIERQKIQEAFYASGLENPVTPPTRDQQKNAIQAYASINAPAANVAAKLYDNNKISPSDITKLQSERDVAIREGRLDDANQIMGKLKLLTTKEYADKSLTPSWHLIQTPNGQMLINANDPNSQKNFEAKPTQNSGLNADLLDDKAIEFAADRYRKTGNMPSLGIGSAIAKSKILNEAARQSIAEGDTNGAATYKQMQGKADQQAVVQLEKQATMVGAFEKTATSNLQLALSLSDKVDRVGSPVFDRWIQAGKKSINGDKDVASFHAANETFINEYAKIMSGSMGNTAISDAARKNAHEILDAAYTKDQYKAVTDTLKTEMYNRIKGFNDQRGEIASRITNTTQSSAQLPTTSGKTQVETPAGTITFPSEAAAQMFKKAHGLQ